MAVRKKKIVFDQLARLGSRHIAWKTVKQLLRSELVARIKDAASYTSGDQSAPCAILWTDPERLWEPILG